MKIKTFSFSPEFIVALLQQGTGHEIVSSGLPSNAKIRGCGFDQHNRTFWLHIEHESFPEILSGAVLPHMPPVEVREVSF